MKNILNEKPNEDLFGSKLARISFMKMSNIKDKVILDIGCGYGWCELVLLKKGAKQVTGIEISEKDLKTARDNVKDKRVDFNVGSAIKLPFPDSSFDTVVSWEVLEHIPKNTEQKMFKEISRVLKKGGVSYLSTPHQHICSNIFDPAWWLIGHRHYSFNQLNEFVESNGMKVVSHKIRGSWWGVILNSNMYIAKWIFRRKPFFEHLLRDKTSEEYKKSKGFLTIFIEFKKV